VTLGSFTGDPSRAPGIWVGSFGTAVALEAASHAWARICASAGRRSVAGLRRSALLWFAGLGEARVCDRLQQLWRRNFGEPAGSSSRASSGPAALASWGGSRRGGRHAWLVIGAGRIRVARVQVDAHARRPGPFCSGAGAGVATMESKLGLSGVRRSPIESTATRAPLVHVRRVAAR
jgi:hypothetical protein